MVALRAKLRCHRLSQTVASPQRRERKTERFGSKDDDIDKNLSMALLTNILIVDATDRFGWLAGRILADLGGDVIKLDPPDTVRSRPDWRAFNANKRVLNLDPAAPADRPQLENCSPRLISAC